METTTQEQYAQIGYRELERDQEIHDFVNSYAGKLQEEEYDAYMEEGGRQSRYCLPEISRRIHKLQEELAGLAALVDQITGY